MPNSELWGAIVLLAIALAAAIVLWASLYRRWQQQLQENSLLRLDNEKAWMSAQYYRVQFEDMELRQRHLDELHRRQVNELQKALTVVQESTTRIRHNEND
ncbi:MAG: Vpu [Vampirovibrionales bacterium]|nr:Vpu [Vampirovibrionales bacterium]